MAALAGFHVGPLLWPKYWNLSFCTDETRVPGGKSSEQGKD